MSNEKVFGLSYKNLSMENSSFLTLLRISLGIDPPMLDAPFTDKQWKEVAVMAKKQAVLGMAAMAMMELPQELRPPKSIKIKLAVLAEKIGEKNVKLNNNAEKLYKTFKDAGMDSCILKGQGIASLYPEAMMRQSGDIDIWVKGDYRDTLRKLKKIGKVGDVFYHHVDIEIFQDKTKVEAHFRPSWLNSPINNKKLQNWFKQNEDKQFANFDNTLGFAKPDSGFNCVYGAIHIYRHLLQEGIGLRQITDYYLILKNSSAKDREKANESLMYFGLKSFLPALMYVLQKIYSLPDDYLLTASDKTSGEFLLDEILKSGNFGRYDDRYVYDPTKGPLKRFVMRMSRLKHYYTLAPSEVLWAPIFKSWQWGWKVINRF